MRNQVHCQPAGATLVDRKRDTVDGNRPFFNHQRIEAGVKQHRQFQRLTDWLQIVDLPDSIDVAGNEMPPQAITEAHGSRVYVRRETGADGQPSETRWRVERRLGDRTVVRLFPATGRRHQIRVHLAAIGHPVLGDILYGRPDRDYLDMVRGVRDARREDGSPLRQLLHCARLVFPVPEGGERSVESPLPPDFAEALGER